MDEASVSEVATVTGYFVILGSGLAVASSIAAWAVWRAWTQWSQLAYIAQMVQAGRRRGADLAQSTKVIRKLQYACRLAAAELPGTKTAQLADEAVAEANKWMDSQ